MLNCLYRPGSMDDIAAVIKQKKSENPIEYIIPCMEPVLNNTYGIIVYQEQIMMLSRLIAGFSRSESALLRMGIGMFKKEILPALRNQFIRGGIKNGYGKTALEKLLPLIKEHRIQTIVLGLPKHMNGDVGIRGQISIDFKEKLLKRKNKIPKNGLFKGIFGLELVT